MKPAITFFLLAAAFLTPHVQQPTVRTSTAGVIVDVTVLDENGRPVTDLQPDDFDVREDGKAQKIVSATLMRGGVPVRLSSVTAAAAAPASPAAPADPASAKMSPPSPAIPTVTAILFDSLSADARPFAVRAAAQFISTLATAHEYAGVFQAGLGLTTVQAFTNDPTHLRTAINQVALTAPNNMSPEAEQKRSTSRTAGLDTTSPVTAGAEDGRGWTNIAEREDRLYGPSMDASEKMFTQIEQRMKDDYMRFLSEMEGEASISGLSAAVQGLAPLPGRKSILYFTEELPVTSRLKSRFDRLIVDANRANVTIYTVDASGLRVHSKEQETARGVDLAGAQGVGDARRADGPWTKELERQEEKLSSRPAAVLGRLANDTGGFMIDNTNDLGKGVARMQVERVTYYLLGYQPTNAATDGKFRKVSVKVKRGKYTVRARPGYVAPRS